MYVDYNLTWESWKGEKLELTDESRGIIIDRVEGLSPVKAEHSTASSPYRDGAVLTNVHIGVRNIAVYLEIDRNVEENKALLYRLFRKKKEGTLYYKSATRDVYIKGYVEDITPDQHSNPVTVQLIIVCFDPYWEDAQAIITEIARDIPQLHFKLAITEPRPFGIYQENNVQTLSNDGDEALGMLIHIYSSGRAEIPKIYNDETGEFFEVGLELFAGDELVINTKDGEHSITLIRSAQEFNVFNAMTKGSTWLKADVGVNTFGATASNGADMLRFMLIMAERYEGV